MQAALQELEELKQIVPKESLVYFLIGKVCLKHVLFLCMLQSNRRSFSCFSVHGRQRKTCGHCGHVCAFACQVYKKLGQTHLALMNFSWAMDLDPKGANNQIKEAIDKRYLPEDEGTPP